MEENHNLEKEILNAKKRILSEKFQIKKDGIKYLMQIIFIFNLYN